jgi:hypothetical protein
MERHKPFKLTFSKNNFNKTAHSKVSAAFHNSQGIMHNCAVVNYFHYMVNQSSPLAMRYISSLISFHVLNYCHIY